MPKVLITGGGRRLGKHFALLFAEMGWDVGIHYFSSEIAAKDTVQLIQNKGLQSDCFFADLRKPDNIQAAFKNYFDKYALPDVLVNNAGVFPGKLHLSSIDVEIWNNTLKLNFESIFWISKAFSGFARSGSKIINIASVGGLEIWKQRLPYNVSKSGVINLTKSLALELAPDITVNCVCPGTIALPDDTNAADSLVSIERVPMKRYGTPQDIFDAVYFFASTNNYTTGQILTVDGGYHLSR